MTQVNAESIGCVPMDGPSGTTEQVAIDNTDRINDYLSSDWRTGRLPLAFPGRGWLVQDTIDLQPLSGHTILGSGGEPIWHHELQYTSGYNGGPISRLVAANLAGDEESNFFESGEPLLRIRGYGNIVERLVLQGLWHPDNIGTLTGDYPMPAGTDLRCATGIEIQGQQAGLGTGKLRCPAGLSVMFCQTAIKCLATPTEDNADQIVINGRFFAPYCDIGFLSENVQSVDNRFDFFDQINCDTAFKIVKGGKLWCGTLVMQSAAQRGLLITGNDSAVNGDGGSFRIDRLEIDAGAPSDCQCVTIAPSSNYSVASVSVGYLQNAYNRSSEPLISINNSYGEVNIYGGMNFYEGMIKVTGGASGAYPTIRIHNAKFKVGHNPAKIFSSDSTGYVQYEFHSCCEMSNSGSPVNEGKLFPSFQGLFNGPYNSTPIWGGYNQHGSVVSVSGAYTAKLSDDTILCNASGGAFTVTLPAAASVPGKIYRIGKVESSGNAVTIDGNGSETIDGATTKAVSAGWGIANIQSYGTAWKVL
jgi:hypothetical protein